MDDALTIHVTEDEYGDMGNVKRYSGFVDTVGLWNSERIVTARYAGFDSAILDIGCGAGRATFGLYRAGYRNLTGIDLSPNMIEACIGRAQRENAGIRFLVVDACAMPFPDGSFDYCLFAMSGLFVIPTRHLREQVMREAGRVLRPGGRFVFTSVDPRCNPVKWAELEEQWKSGTLDKRLEFGDFYIYDKSLDNGTYAYFHIPPAGEIEESIAGAGLLLEDSFIRSSLTEESESVHETSNDVTFWVCRKSEG